MVTTQFEALDAMLRHHESLVNDVGRLVARLSNGPGASNGFESARAELLAFLADEVIPHAMAEEVTVYQAADTLEELRITVCDMTDEHRTLIDAVASLAGATSAAETRVVASRIEALFNRHVERENLVLLPALLNNGVDLAELLESMRAELAPTLREPTTLAVDDPIATILSLFLDATTDLARIGEGERACSLAAAAWTALRSAHPDLAASVTARLHHLARSIASEPVELRARSSHASNEAFPVLDVRALAPAQRHEAIFARYHALNPGGGYLLVNDHDPVPLRYQFEAEYPGAFTWDVVEAGPEVWRVRIERPGEPVMSDTGDDLLLDVRTLAPVTRHEEIFSTFDHLAPGGAFVIVNDHDPKPLRFQFEAQHAGAYSWHYLEAGPRVWRVRVARR